MGEAAPLIGIPEAPVPDGAEPEWFSGAGGLRLRAARFPAVGQARGSVVLSGGRTEPIEKYFEVIAELRARGFTVLAHDWRGQGLSDRLLKDQLRGHAGRADDFLADLSILLSRFEDRLPKPWIALAHSMGACLLALALIRGEGRFAQAVFTAPMFGLSTGAAPLWFARGLARLAKGVGAAAMLTPGPPADLRRIAFEDNILTHDPARFARMKAQLAACPDLALGAPTWGWLEFAFAAMNAIERGAGGLATPLLVAAAGAERLVDPAATRRITQAMPGARLIEIPGAFHEALQETDVIRAQFWDAFDGFVGAAG